MRKNASVDQLRTKIVALSQGGLSYGEIADRFNLSRGAVSGVVSRSKIKSAPIALEARKSEPSTGISLPRITLLERSDDRS